MVVKRLSRWLLLVIAGAALALPAAAGAEVLYDQTDNAGELPFGTTTPNFSPSTFYSETNYDRTADDFTVPEGEVWTIEQVEAPGYALIGGPGVNVLLYPDAGGVPGAPLFEQRGIPVGGPGRCVCPTGAPQLPAGRYWITVQMQANSGDWWTWRTRTQQSGAPAQYMDKVPGCSGPTGPWARRASCFPSDNPDQVFMLSGTKSAPVGSSAFTLGALSMDRKKGTATQVVTVPGAGSLELIGQDVGQQAASASAPGDVALKVKPTGKLKKKLKKNGKAKTSVTVSFTPTAGAASTQDVTVELKRKAKKTKG